MNKIERLARSLGRIRGAFSGGMKSAVDMGFNDSRAWSTYGGFSGIGSAGPGKKPASPADVIENYFTSWVYICASLNARSCAAIPLRLYGGMPSQGRKMRWAGTDVAVPTRKISRAKRAAFEKMRHLQPYMAKAEEVEEIVEHPFLDLMRNVNPYSNMSDLLELTVMFLDLAGDSYWYLVKNGAGVPESIWSIPSQYVTPVIGDTLDEFIIGYKFERGQVSVVLPIADVVAFQYPNPKSQITGFAPVLGIADAAYNNSQMNIYEASLFENKARVDGLFEVDQTVPMAQVERAKEKFAAEFAGTQAAGKRPLLPPGMKFTKTSMTAEEISFIEGRKLSREEIAAGLDVPISLLDPNSIRSNVEGAQYYHAKYGIEPRLRKIEEKLNEKLLPMYGAANIFCAFDNPVPEDKIFDLDARVKQTGAPIMSIDEARAEIGKDALDMPGVSDVPLIPMGLKPLKADMADEPEPVAAPPAFGGAPAAAPEGEEPEVDEEEEEDDIAERAIRALQRKLGL